MHIGIVTALIFLFLKLMPIGRSPRYLLTIALLLFYALITGLRPSVIRATIMAAILLLGLFLEREAEAVNSLSLAAFVLLMINPLNLFDAGFQLSFLSVISIILFYPELERVFQCFFDYPPDPVRKMILKFFFVSIAAWLGVAGIIAYYFNMITPVTIFANLVIVPLISVVVALGFGMVLSHAFVPVLSLAFSSCLKVMLNFMVLVIYFFDKIPGSCFYVKNVQAWHVLCYYSGIFILYLSLKALKLTK